MSHPFSVAWTENSNKSTPSTAMAQHISDSKARTKLSPSSSISSGPLSPSSLEKQSFDLDVYLEPAHNPTQVSLIVGAQQGMTRRLFNLANKSPLKTLTIPGYIEGPYGSHPANTASYGTAALFSAGAGITHHLRYTQDLVLRASTGQAATRKVYLIWSVRSTDHLSWITQWMDQILRLPQRRDILVVKLFVSKPRRQADIVSPSTTVQMHSGRCRPDVVLDEVLPGRVGATLVSVCGPGAFADEVRAAARNRIGKGAVVDFVEEAFTW